MTKQNEKYKIFDLIIEDDFEQISNDYGLTCTLDELKKYPSLLFDKVSFTTFTTEFLSSKGDTVNMLFEVLNYVSKHVSRTRTTGCMLMLKDDYSYNSQMVDAITDFSKQSKIKKISIQETLESIRRNFRKVLLELFESINFNESTETDIIGPAMRQYITGNSERVKKSKSVSYDPVALKYTASFLDELYPIVNKAALSEKSGIGEFFKRLSRTIKVKKSELFEIREVIGKADQKKTERGNRRSINRTIEKCKIIKEDILNLFRLNENTNDYSDILRFDLFRNRPQLFEVWVLITIIKNLGKTGELKLLSTKEQNGKFIWNLNYAKSALPVAEIIQPDGTKIEIYYQYFKPGVDSNNMPDILISDGQCNWVLDPKHSFKKGYSISNYKEVCLRYFSEFKPTEKSLILEYFTREDLKIKNPEIFKQGCELITDVSPNGDGLRLLITNITSNQILTNSTIYIVDVSGSFVRHFGDIIKIISENDYNRIHGIVLFSDKAVKYSDPDEVIEKLEIDKSIMGNGTNFQSALEIVSDNLFNDQFDCVLYSDCQFSSKDLDELNVHLNDGNLSIVRL